MRLKATLATLLVVILLSGSCAVCSCGAACAVDELQGKRDQKVGTSSASPVAQVTTHQHCHASDAGTIQPNFSTDSVSDSAGCDDHDCDAAPAVVQSDERLNRDFRFNPAVLVVFQTAEGRPGVDRTSLQMPLLRSTSPPSHMTILRV